MCVCVCVCVWMHMCACVCVPKRRYPWRRRNLNAKGTSVRKEVRTPFRKRSLGGYEVGYSGIYIHSKDSHSYAFVLNDRNFHDLTVLVRSKDKHIDPMAWMINLSKQSRLAHNT